MNHALDPAESFDPVRLRFLEALARRARDSEGTVKHLLEDKLARAMAAYQERVAQHTDAASELQRLESPPQPTALAELTRTLTQHLPINAPASMGGRPELKSIRYFRDTWSKLSVDKQLSQAIAQGPENAGPLNSHQLVLRSLSVMRDISPDYLNRFMSYVDALLWLDQADSMPVAKSAPDDEGRKKRKTSHAR